MMLSRYRGALLIGAVMTSFLLATVATPRGGASADEAHGDSKAHGDSHEMLERMREMHKGHEHEEQFEAMERMSPEELSHEVEEMLSLGLAIPPLDPAEGRELFVSKGCVVCHQVNGVGGTVGPSLDSSTMAKPMNAFEFAARMWRGAEAMVPMQRALFGEPIDLSGDELLQLVAFVHDADEQAKLTEDQIPDQIRDMIQK